MTEQKKSRMTLHRETNLEADERKLVDDIEKYGYGCHVVHVKPQQPIPGWSYTIGLYETLQQPELIVVGMKQDLASFWRETKNITSNQAFANFSSLFFIFLLTSICVLWHT